MEGAWAGGAQASGRRIGRLATGFRGDIVVLDTEHAALVGREEDDALDSWLFAGDSSPVRDVFVGGVQTVDGGRHVLEDEIAGRYAAVARALGAGTPQLDLDLAD